MSTDHKKRILQWKEMYKSKVEFETENAFCRDLVEHFRWLSNFVHPLPLSFERIDNERGRGLASDIDVTHCLTCLMLARKYLAVTTISIADFFEERFVTEFKDLIDEVRLLQSKGFEAIAK